MKERRVAVAEAMGLPEEAPELEEALTHTSYANERRGVRDNQRLEFLGDAVLGLAAASLVHRRFPEADEGTLTRLRARLVNAETLADRARELGVQEALRLGKGAGTDGLADSKNVLADAMEALLGAVFLRGGLAAAEAVVDRLMTPLLASIDPEAPPDPKSALQELCQAEEGRAPVYEVVAETGPPHDRCFEVEARLGDALLGRGTGRSKRAAERAAAEAGLLARRRAPAPGAG